MGLSVPRLTFSVDLELEIEQQGDELEQRLESLTARLAELFDGCRIPATWAVADPAVSAATPMIQSRKLPHEFAILGDQTWLGWGADQGRISRELTRRLLNARQAGIEIETLALRHVELGNEFELLKQSGIKVVRNGHPLAQRTFVSRPSEIARRDVLEAYATLRFPASGRWWRWQTFLAKRIIRRACAEANTCHVVIDCAKLIETNDLELRGVKSLLQFTARMREQRQLEICTLSKFARSTALSPITMPAHSILRSAA